MAFGRKKTKIILAFMGLVIAYIAAKPYICDWFISYSLATSNISNEAFEPYEDTTGRVIRLSDEQTEPFLYAGGRIVRTLEPLQNKFGKSLERFPTVRHCLKWPQLRKLRPDLTKISWDRLSNAEDASVCLFRIASSYATPEDMKRWFEANGLEAKIIPHPIGSNKGLVATISLDENWPKFSANIFMTLWIRFIAYGMSISVGYNENNEVISAAVSHSIL